MKYAIILALLAHPALASEPDEQTKIEALKLGYILNGNSMATAVLPCPVRAVSEYR